MDNYFSKQLHRWTEYQRYKTRVVNIGDIPMGGDHPIRIQSMTNTNTMDTEGTVAQCIRLVDAGCDYVRITAPSVKEARNLGVIKTELKNRGYSVPLIADIHFVPRAAEAAARLVEKVRVNPGNYVERKNFEQLEYSDSEYRAELDRIRERFMPLVRICREEGTAMRIGSNHGSLSDRILNHYGDTPLGMVESAMEFIRICADEKFHDLVISMKASNTRVMIQAYRLLVDHMEREGFNYPLHLGVTEAGDGDDARLKSAVGIGSLLHDGFGDTIRVSLTEAPEAEIPVAQALVRSISEVDHGTQLPALKQLPIVPFAYRRRAVQANSLLGGDQAPIVIADLSDMGSTYPAKLLEAGYRFNVKEGIWEAGDTGADILYFGNNTFNKKLSKNTVILYDSGTWQSLDNADNQYPLFDMKSFKTSGITHPTTNFIRIDSETQVEDLPHDPTIIWVLSSRHPNRMAASRRFMLNLMINGLTQPVILANNFIQHDRPALLLESAAYFGSLLNDGLGDGIWLKSNEVSLADLNTIAFGILQASRSRMTKTEYIACPSCGRTLFDLEDVTAQIRSRTGHLKGVKIGIMGCIVNGPGEMADADFGYVGTGPGRVSLYRGQMVVRSHIPQGDAVDSLIDLIKQEGFWVDSEKQD